MSSWTTPTIDAVRTQNRDYITGKLQKPLIPNDYPRVLADANAGNAHLNLQYLDWQSNQFLPDTAEQQFLDRHGNIWLVNADGSRGRKAATFASGTATLAGLVAGAILPQAAQLTGSTAAGPVTFETTAPVTIGIGANPVPIRALTAGSAANLDAGTSLSLTVAVAGIDASSVVVASLSGGADQESDDDLRARVLERIQKPPMGGDADDYVQWAKSVPGVTRAWSSPCEMGIGTVTIRFMCDDLRAANNGLPTSSDLAAVQAYVDSVRPAGMKDFFVVAPVLQPVPFKITGLADTSASARAAIRSAVAAMLRTRAAPAHAVNGVPQPAIDIPAAWVSNAILTAVSGASFDLVMADAVMASKGCMAISGSITYA